MSTFQRPPHFRNVFVELPDGSTQIDQGWHDWFLNIATLLSKGYTGTVPLAQLTGPGSQGSLTFQNGIVVSVVEPT